MNNIQVLFAGVGDGHRTDEGGHEQRVLARVDGDRVQFQDFDGFGHRSRIRTPVPHTFGVGTLSPLVTGTQATLGAFPWYWGTSRAPNPTVNGWTSFIYGAIHYAGPTLTAKNVQKGLFTMPAAGARRRGGSRSRADRALGRASLRRVQHAGHRQGVDLVGSEGARRANAVATIVGDGKFRYINNSKRVRYGQLPTKLPPYFDASKAVTEDAARLANEGVRARQRPCAGCPSSQQ